MKFFFYYYYSVCYQARLVYKGFTKNASSKQGQQRARRWYVRVNHAASKVQHVVLWAELVVGV